jgi:hypothetical protein
MTFEQWKAKVDEIISDRIGGLTSDDLPDMCYRDLFDQEFTPDEAAQMSIENAQGS